MSVDWEIKGHRVTGSGKGKDIHQWPSNCCIPGAGGRFVL